MPPRVKWHFPISGVGRYRSTASLSASNHLAPREPCSRFPASARCTAGTSTFSPTFTALCARLRARCRSGSRLYAHPDASTNEYLSSSDVSAAFPSVRRTYLCGSPGTPILHTASATHPPLTSGETGYIICTTIFCRAEHPSTSTRTTTASRRSLEGIRVSAPSTLDCRVPCVGGC